MANKATTYTIKIDAELADLKGKVAQAKASLDGLLKSGQAPKGLISSFERIEAVLGRIQDQASMPPSKTLFSSLQKDVGKVGLAFGDLMRNISALSDVGDEVKFELFSADEQAKIQAVIKGLSDYEKALEAIKQKEKEVEKARKTKETTTKASSAAKSKKITAKCNDQFSL